MVQRLPLGAISHFSASSGMYAPVERSIPTRNSKAGRLSRLPLRAWSQVKLVSYPMGATAILSRSSFAWVWAGGVAVCAQVRVATQPRAQRTPPRNSRRRDVDIGPSLCLLRTRDERDCWSDGNAWHTD